MKLPGIVFFSLAVALPALGQHVTAPHASVVDVAARQATLRSTSDPLLLAAIKGLQSCVALPFVSAPVGRMDIPHHYLSGSSGPINPAEAVATRPYAMFEGRITAGNGAFPKEMARHENAIHYQGFALEPLVLIAQFGARQGVDLYGYQDDKRSLRDAIVFFGRAVNDPSLVKPYTNDAQAVSFGSGSFAAFAFYAARYGTDGLPPAIVNALKSPTTSTRLGGCTTILAAK